MKRLLALTGLAALLVLTACGGGGSNGDETTCTMESPWGTDTITVQSEDGQITSGTSEERVDVSGWDADEIAEEIAWMTENNDGMSCSASGNTLVCTETASASDLESMGFPLDLEEFISAMEGMGASCS